jgi:hypothetical protein
MKLKIGSANIPVRPGTSLALVLRSPLFDNSDGKTPGSFIFNCSLPASPALRNVFAQAHRTNRAGRATAELPYTIQSGSLRYSGKCSVQEASNMQYDILFNVRNGDFAAEVSKKTLKDLDLGGDRPIAITKSAAHDFFGYSRSQYNTASFYDSTTLTFSHIDLDVNTAFNSNASIFTFQHTENVIATINYKLIPVYGLHFYVDVYLNSSVYSYAEITETDYEKAFDVPGVTGDHVHLNLRVESEFTGSQYAVSYDISDMYIEYQSEINSSLANDSYAVFPIENADHFANFPDDAYKIDNLSAKTMYSEYFKVLNYYTNRFPVCIKGLIEDEIVFAANLFVPFVFVKRILDQIANEFNYTLIGSPFESDQEYYNCVLFNSFAENTYPVDSSSMLGVKETFNLVDHVPSTPISTFLNSLGKITGRRLDIDTEFRTITFVRLRSVIQSTNSYAFPGTITDPPVITVAPEFKGYKIDLKASADKYISEQIKTVIAKHVYKGSVNNKSLLPSSGNKVNDMYLVTELNELHVWKYSTELYVLAWEFHSKNFYLTKEIGVEPFLQITCEMSPILDYNTRDETVGAPPERAWVLPVTRQAGNFEGFPDMSAEYGMQILFYKGMQLDSNGNQYPLAISGNKNYSGSTFENPTPLS